MTTTMIDPQSIQWTPELLASAKQALAAQAEAKKAAAAAAARALQAAFAETLPTFEPWLADVELTHTVQTWYKRDPKTKELTDEVRSKGYLVKGKATVQADGRLREVAVTTFVSWSPSGGSAPVDLSGEPQD